MAQEYICGYMGDLERLKSGFLCLGRRNLFETNLLYAVVKLLEYHVSCELDLLLECICIRVSLVFFMLLCSGMSGCYHSNQNS